MVAPRPCSSTTGSPCPALSSAMSPSSVSTRPTSRRSGPVMPVVAARKPTPRWRSSRSFSRPRRNASMPPRTSSATRRQVAESADIRASGRSPPAGSSSSASPSITASQSPSPSTRSRITARPRGASKGSGSKRSASVCSDESMATWLPRAQTCVLWRPSHRTAVRLWVARQPGVDAGVDAASLLEVRGPLLSLQHVAAALGHLTDGVFALSMISSIRCAPSSSKAQRVSRRSDSVATPRPRAQWPTM